MVIFIDESGTHKQEGHSTVAVVYLEISNKEEFETKMAEILEKLKLLEFHWADQGWEVRKKYFKLVESLKFSFKAAIFENPVHPDRMMVKVFQQMITEDNIKWIFIDGKKPKWYEKGLKRVLRDKGLSVGKLRTIRKETSYLGIQLADALAGLVRYNADSPKAEDAAKILKKLKGKLIYQAEFNFKDE